MLFVILEKALSFLSFTSGPGLLECSIDTDLLGMLVCSNDTDLIGVLACSIDTDLKYGINTLFI